MRLVNSVYQNDAANAMDALRAVSVPQRRCKASRQEGK